VGFGPIEHSVHGELVYDFKIQHVGLVEDDHHRLHVEADEIQIVHGSNEFEELVSRYPTLRCISEVSFGINPVWTQVDSPHSIVEEKNLGTVHFGAGGNFSYGNRKGPHFDSVIHSPTVWLDGVPIMQDGRFLETFLSLEVLESIPKMFRGSV
jgi:leucyl aminopeptidase (aminopeptidase T)